MLNENQRSMIDGLVLLLEGDDKVIAQQVANYLLELGYVPQKQKGSRYALDFKSNKLKEKIAKLGINDNRLTVSLKFYACGHYSQKFREGLQSSCDWYFTDAGKVYTQKVGEKYIACGCGGCKNYSKAYTFEYPDGKVLIRCGKELVRVQNLTADDIDEMKSLLLEQHTFLVQYSFSPSK